MVLFYGNSLSHLIILPVPFDPNSWPFWVSFSKIKTKTKTNTDAITMTKTNTEAMTYTSILWQLSVLPLSSCPIWSQQLTLLSVFSKTVTKKRHRKRQGKGKDKTKTKTNGFVLLQIAFPPHLSSCPIWLARLDPIRPYLWSFLHRKWSELRLFERRAFTQCNEEKESKCRYRTA